MSRFTQPSQDDGSYILVIRMDNARNLSSILKTVSFREVSYMHQQASNMLWRYISVKIVIGGVWFMGGVSTL